MNLRNISSKKLIKAMLKFGFEYAPIKGKGSHIALLRIENQHKHIIIIPKRDPIPIGTLNSIIRQTGLSKEEFNKMLKEFY